MRATFVPLLALFGLWKHVVNRRPLRYQPVMWSLVFPLGMYAVTSARMGLATEMPALGWIATGMTAAAALAWTLTLVGLGRHLVAQWRSRSLSG